MTTSLEREISKILGEGLSGLPCPSNWFPILGRADSAGNDGPGEKPQQGAGQGVPI